MTRAVCDPRAAPTDPNVSLLNIEAVRCAVMSCPVMSAGRAAWLRVGQVASDSSHRIVNRLGPPGPWRMHLSVCLPAAAGKHCTRRGLP